MNVPRIRRFAAAAIAYVFVAVPTLGAQQIRGLIRDSTTGTPVAGAVVSLIDDAGTLTGRTIADGSGRFRAVGQGNATKLQVLRIGYRPQTTPLPQAAPGQSAADVVVDMVPVPTLLETVAVQDASVCPRREDHDRAFGLWEQARAALLASVVAREANPATVETLVYDRQLDHGGHDIISQSVRSERGRGTRPFNPARTPAAFADFGFVTDVLMDRSGNLTRTYDAPDAEVLLDESFARTHCFSVTPSDASHHGQLGLAFEPAPGRDTLADIAGVLWVRPSAGALDSLAFHYTGLEPAVMEAGAGGSVSFRTMPNGVIFVERWHVRMPLLAPAVGLHRDPTAPVRVARRFKRDVRVSEIDEHGGLVASAVWADGVRWTAPLGEVQGRVMSDDPAAPTPIVSAIVWLDGAARRVITDASGGFRFEGVLAGPYKLQVSDSTLAAFGAVRTVTQHVMVRDSGMIDANVRMPRLRALERICGRDLMRDRGALVLDLTRARGGDGASYVVQWHEASGGIFRAGRVDALGRAALCDVPLNQPVNVAVRGEIASDTTVLLPADRVAIVTPRLGDGRPAAASVSGANVLVVRVGDAGAEVTVPSSTLRGQISARTNSEGVAVIRGLQAGAHDVIVRALGHTPVIGVVDVVAHDSLDVSLEMASTAAELSAVRVQADRASVRDRVTGFAQRRATAQGYFVTEDSIAKSNPFHTTDLLAHIPGVRISEDARHAGDRVHVYSSHDAGLLLGGNDPRSGLPCELAVWLDGQPMDTSFDINTIPPGAIHGIEVYHTATTPAQFTAVTTFTNACGSLVIWTK